MKNLNIMIAAFTALLVISCAEKRNIGNSEFKHLRSKEQIQELMVSFQEIKNEIQVKREMNGFVFEACIIPSEILAAIAMDTSSIEGYNKIQAIELTIRTPSGKDLLDYPSRLYKTKDEKINYFSSTISRQFRLLSNEENLYPIEVYFESSLGMKPFSKVTIYFNKPLKADNWTLSYDEEYFGLGILQFQFNSKQIHPTL